MPASHRRRRRDHGRCAPRRAWHPARPPGHPLAEDRLCWDSAFARGRREGLPGLHPEVGEALESLGGAHALPPVGRRPRAAVGGGEQGDGVWIPAESRSGALTHPESGSAWWGRARPAAISSSRTLRGTAGRRPRRHRPGVEVPELPAAEVEGGGGEAPLRDRHAAPRGHGAGDDVHRPLALGRLHCDRRRSLLTSPSASRPPRLP